MTEDNDPFSFKSRLMQKVEHQYGRLPTGVQKAGRFIAVTHDTSLYKLLHKSTTLSDFIARYAVIQHMTTRAKNPMSLEDAQQFAVKAFVNYDLPTHPNLQKANDLGAVFFTKYYLRIQTVLLQVMQDNPGKTMAMALLANMLPTFPFINEVGFWNRLNNPFDWGALKYPDSVGELIPLQMGAALLSD